MLFEAWHCLKCFWTPLKKVENENKIYVKPGVWITFSIRGCAKKKAAMLAQPKHDSLHIQDKKTAVRGFTGGGRLATSLITETPVQHPKECIIFYVWLTLCSCVLPTKHDTQHLTGMQYKNSPRQDKQYLTLSSASHSICPLAPLKQLFL